MIQMNSRRLNTPVGALNLVFNDMRQRDFDQLRIPPMLIQDGAGHGAHVGKHMQRERPLNVLGIGRRDRIFF